MDYIRKGESLGTAMRRSEEDHGLTGKTIEGKKTKLGFITRPDGTITFEGFRAPSALADTVAGGAAPSTAPAAPVIAPVAPASPAAPAPAAPAPAALGTVGNPVKVNTKEERDALPSGTVYVAPDGVVRTKG
jgi:hypothetical protein